MAKTVKKIDVKMVLKQDVMEIASKAFASAGFQVLDGEAFGMTKGTVIVRTATGDVQIKPVTPKTGLTHYVEAEAE